MVSLERYNELKASVDRLRREHDRAEGALGQAMGKLRERFGCETLADARAALKKAERDCQQKGKAFERALAKFEEEWGEKLGE